MKFSYKYRIEITLIFLFVLIFMVTNAAMKLHAQRPQQPQLGICIYETIYLGPPENRLVVAWTQPPCSNTIGILNSAEHNRMQHSSAPTGCGRAAIYNNPRLNAPAADTFPQLCLQRNRPRNAEDQSQ